MTEDQRQDPDGNPATLGRLSSEKIIRESEQFPVEVLQTELGSLKDDLLKMEQATRIKDDRIRQLEESIKLFRENLDVVAKALTFKPSPEELQLALRRKEQSRGARSGIGRGFWRTQMSR